MKVSIAVIISILMSSNCLFSQFKTVVTGSDRIEFDGKFPQLWDLQEQQKPVHSFSLKKNKLHLSTALSGNLKINKFLQDNGSTWVSGQSRHAIDVRTKPMLDKAIDYLSEVYATTRFSSPNIEIEGISSSTDELGVNHFQFRQKLNKLPIFESESYIHGGEHISSFNGKTYSFPKDLETAPQISLDNALDLVFKDMQIDKFKRDALLIPQFTSEETSELGYIENKGTFSLAYHFEVHKNTIEKWEYYLDAISGTIINKIPLICKFHNHELNSNLEFNGPSVSNGKDLFGSSSQINTYNIDNFFFLIDVTRTMYDQINSTMPNEPVGVIWTIDAFDTSPENEDFKYGHVLSNNNSWTGKENPISAHQNAGKAYEYYKNVHGRESINGEGGNIISLVNIADKDGKSLENAFWNGSAMFYGSGGQAFLPLARGLDVAAHEMSHGVIQNTANLTYQGESGAINESMADIFGAMVDRDDWLIGEDVVNLAVFPSGALRNLQDPHNGANQGDYGNGFQPKHVSEQYLGNADNGGVHLNSGIPNHAFYIFASEIGKEKAEQIYYRALTRYLLKSSQFIDLRLAVIQAAEDIDNNNDGAEASAAAAAFDQVGILDSEGGDYQQDLESNNGNEYMLATSADKSELYLYNSSYQPLFRLFDNGILNKPSVADDGSLALFVGGDNKIYTVFLNWDTGIPSIALFSEMPIWRNVVISKDKSKVAALYNDDSNRIFVYDYASQSGVDFELFNPTFTEGVITDNVNFADAMEFDFSGNYIMYDAKSTFPSTNAEPITVWDIGFLKIWNEKANTWSLGSIEKLFTNLPEGTSVGNPTFSKNSPYIITFDRKNEKNEYYLMGANIETGELNNLVQNDFWNVPNYSIDDQKVVVDFFNDNTFDLVTLDVDDSKIKFVSQSIQKILNDRRWGIWFANGERSLNTATNELERISIFSSYPNPSSDHINFEFNSIESAHGTLQIFGYSGNLVHQEKINTFSGINKFTVDINHLMPGTYLSRIIIGDKVGAKLFIKQ
jgi:Zn-dependent metalloprotease